MTCSSGHGAIGRTNSPLDHVSTRSTSGQLLEVDINHGRVRFAQLDSARPGFPVDLLRNLKALISGLGQADYFFKQVVPAVFR